MPWIRQDDCTGCGVCVEECPPNAIIMEGEKARIDMEECIRCGVCHDVCPQDAVRHDSEKISEVVQANVDMTKRFMEACERHFGDEKEKWKCLERMIKNFNRERMIAEKTREQLTKLRRET
jgi:formate hydrogenlyase subunit 6/NADH:ubiquinone oxidoreductase subunit I